MLWDEIVKHIPRRCYWIGSVLAEGEVGLERHGIWRAFDVVGAAVLAIPFIVAFNLLKARYT